MTRSVIYSSLKVFVVEVDLWHWLNGSYDAAGDDNVTNTG